MSFLEKKLNKILIGAVLGGGVSGLGGKQDPQERVPNKKNQGFLGHIWSSVLSFLHLGLQEMLKSSKKSS